MIYLDTSVALAELFAEDRVPPPALWHERLVACRLVEYELWTRLHARGQAVRLGETARLILGRIAFLELAPSVLARALDPFPVAVRALDALHLAAVEFLRGRGQTVVLASYDARMLAAARALGVSLYTL